MKEFRKIALCASFLPLIYSPIAYSLDLEEQPLTAMTHAELASYEKETYTINFKNVSIVELINFASKITNLNFIYDENELQFNVTIVSKEGVPAKTVMSALALELRAHNFRLVEQDGNVIITQNPNINAIAPIISADTSEEAARNAALVTRIFRIKNANMATLANILRPMMSQGALIEISPETRQLIICDIATNVEQIETLLVTLDTPNNVLEMENYTVKNVGPEELIGLTKQILTPFADGNTLLMIPQPLTNSVYVISTPYLVERAMSVMEDLDLPSKQKQIGSMRHVFLYNPINRPAKDLVEELKQVNQQLKNGGGGETPLKIAIDGVKEVEETGALLFLADKETREELKGILAALDSSLHFISQSAQVFVYKPHYSASDQIVEALDSLIPSLKKTHTQADKTLIDAIHHLRWNKEMQAFIVTTDTSTMERLQAFLAAIDTPQQLSSQPGRGFSLYKLEYADCRYIKEQLEFIAKRLPEDSLQNQNLVASIHGLNCIEVNNSILINGPSATIEQIKALIADFDVVTAKGEKETFIIYKPKFVPGPALKAALGDLAEEFQKAGLGDARITEALLSVRYVTSTGSLVFTGDKETLQRVESILEEVDSSSGLGGIHRTEGVTFFLYKIEHAPHEKLLESLKSFALGLKTSDVEDKELAKSLENAKWVKETNALLFTGPASTLEQVAVIVKRFDTSKEKSPVKAGPPPRVAVTFAIYSPKYVSGPDLITALDEFEQNLAHAGVADPELFEAIDHIKWVDSSSSLLISGTQSAIDKIVDLLQKHLDLPRKSTAAPAIESIDNTSFLVYKLQYHPGNDIQVALKQIAQNLRGTEKTPSALFEAISSIQWIQVTNSLLCSGQQNVLVQLKELIQSIDVPLRQVFIEVLVIRTDLNNIQNFGLMWGAQSQYFTKATMAGGNFPLPGAQNSSNVSPVVNTFLPTLQGINATTTPAGGATGHNVPFVHGFDLGVIGDVIMHKGKSFLSLGALVNAIQTDTDTTVLLNPKLVAQDNRQSTIFVGTNVPYTGALVTTSSNSTTTTQNIEYRDVGVSLTITPVLGDGDVVTMDIVQDISEVINTGTQGSTTTPAAITGITTSQTHMETRVQVPDNYFVALSGMINDSKTQFRSGIPCLGGLPVIGALFSETDRSATKSNIIIFVRPKIITTYEEFKKITEHQEWLYKDEARLPVLKEWFDEGIDLVKVPENE